MSDALKDVPNAVAGHRGQNGRPTIDVLESELARLGRALEALQRKRRYPLERAPYLLLRLLNEDGPQPVTELADKLLLDDSTVTRQIAVMERQKLVDRLPHPNDGRSTLIRATEEGLKIASQMRDMRLGRIALLFDGWDETDRTRLASLLGRLNGSLTKAAST